MSPELTKARICAERERLSKRVIEAVSELAALQSEHSSDLIRGGNGLPRIEVAVEAARKKWEQARNAYIGHIKQHRC